MMDFFDSEFFFRSGTIEYFNESSNTVLPNTFIDDSTGECSLDRQEDRIFDDVVEKFKIRFKESKNHYGVAYFKFKDAKSIIDIIKSPSGTNKYHCHYISDLGKAVLLSKISNYKKY